MQIHNVKRNTKRKTHTQLGRGGRHGKTSGRGGKGQTARAGNKRRPQMRDEIKKIPKLRGYKFASIQNEFYPINLDALETKFSNGDVVSLETLVAKNVIRIKGGKNPRVKILARGALTKKLSVKGCTMSATAKAAVEKAGGTVEA